MESPEEAARLDSGGKPVAVISQTTLSLDDVRTTVDALETRFGTLKRPAADDICYATQNRQDAVKRLAEEATLILVIGSQTSSNAQRLVEVARNAGAAAELIDGESELPDVSEHEVIGLTAGASTPEQLVEATIARLAARGYESTIDYLVGTPVDPSSDGDAGTTGNPDQPATPHGGGCATTDAEACFGVSFADAPLSPV